MTVIVTSRLLLTKPSQKNLKTMVKWLNDPDIVQFSEQRHRKHDEESQAHYIDNGPDVFREIHAGQSFIGTITASIDKNNSVANVGILIGEKSEWGKGYGTEAWRAFCEQLLRHGIRKIEAGAMACNFGMMHIFRKTGMHEEAVIPYHFLLDGKLIDMVQWGKFSD